MNGLQPSMREVRLPPRVLLGLGQIDVLSSQLIDYGKLGDTNERAMRMADFWLTEKDLIPKLFQVLAPRYQEVLRLQFYSKVVSYAHSLQKIMNSSPAGMSQLSINL
ncbi:39S ribosomal protein L17, mitochondrial [Myotis davidii]|uniref:39S ribosomal protein L17, mitochondrial n=1 Tax=Myotis davidii TaxID=225400 RepID=L5LGQ1_MYODS|nr:39S ribosomal protein L17, mitochondrial [Myotis davidii]